MDTFHGAIADTSYYMRENFAWTAPFLTPLGLLTAKQVSRVRGMVAGW